MSLGINQNYYDTEEFKLNNEDEEKDIEDRIKSD